MKTHKLMWAVLAAWVIVVAPSAKAEVPAVVQRIPEDAQVFVAMPNLTALSRKVSQLNQQAGLNVPPLTDPLTMAKSRFGLRHGLRDDGGAALVILSLPLPDPDQPRGGPHKEGKGLILLPVSDYQAFLNNFQGPAGGGDAGQADQGGGEGIREITWMGKPGFIRQAGDFAVLSDDREVLSAYHDAGENSLAERTGEFGGRILSEAETMVYVNLQALSPKLRPIFKSALDKARRRLEHNPQAAAAEPMMRLYGQALDAIVRDAQAGLTGLDLTEQGVRLSFAAQFTEGSDLAGAFQDAPDEAPSFNLLPDRPFLFAATVDFSGLPVDQWIDELLEALPEEEEGNAMLSMMRPSLSLWKQAGDRAQQAWYAPSMGEGAANPGGLLNAATVITPDDPKAFVKQNRELIKGIGEVKLDENITYKATYQEDIMQVGEHQVDQFNISYDLPPEVMAQMGPLAMIFGQGLTYYITATDDTVITTTGADAGLVNAVVKTAGGDGNLDAAAGLSDVRGKLGANRFAEAYIGVGPIMRTAQGFMAMFAPNARWEAPQDLPPVGIGFSAKGGGAAERVYVPTKVIRAVADLVKKLSGADHKAAPAAQAPRESPTPPVEHAAVN